MLNREPDIQVPILMPIGKEKRKEVIIMKITCGMQTIERLEQEGWAVHHSALFNGYKYAGAVSVMDDRKGYEFCRVHHGSCKSSRGRRYQHTTVMARRIDK